MSTSEKRPSIPGFKALSSTIYLYEPPPDTRIEDRIHKLKAPVSTSIPPSTIMLFGWAGAHPRNVAKYADVYKQLFPSATIIVVLFSIMSVFLNKKAMAAQVHPAVTALLKSTSASSIGFRDEGVETRGKTLIHAFSNTGGMNLLAACQYHRSVFGSQLPHDVLILDSTPGGGNFRTELGRWTQVPVLGAGPLFPFLPRWVVRAFAVFWCLVVWVLPEVFLGVQNPVTLYRRSFNDPSLLAQQAKRLYLYSEQDDLIGWDAVESHAVEAKLQGWQVGLEKFAGSQHVSHMRMHPKQYWLAVGRIWEEAAATI